jgi:uncharacterized protein YbjQ (UPF0145 family)
MSIASLFPGSLWLYLGAGIAAAAAGGWGGWEAKGLIDAPSLSRSQAETQKVTAEYAGYRATVAIAAANATAHSMAEQKRLQGEIGALEDKLAESQRKENAKSEALKAILAGAKAADMRPVGPSAGAYYDRLRADASDRAAGP